MKLSYISWNLVGLSLPLLVAVITVPSLLETIGAERFGLLTLAWGLIGYAGVLDLGIGRALTQMVARLRGEEKDREIPDVLSTASRITFLSGCVGGVLITLAALWGGDAWVATRTTPSSEIVYAMLLMSIALPAQAMSATYRGLNEAYQNFKEINLIRIVLGVITFGGPYILSFYTQRLPWLVFTIVISRLVALIFFYRSAISCLKKAGFQWTKRHYEKAIAGRLFTFGGWATVSSIVSPILVQADRFLIASVLSATTVTIYVLPFEVVTKTLILSGAVSSVLFPSLSKMMGENIIDWQPRFYRWVLFFAGVMLGICFLLGIILPTLLELWLGDNLDPKSIVIGRILCVGVFFNSIGAMFYSYLHAGGRASITARLHLAELPVFIFVLYVLLKVYGVQGAAFAWSVRTVFDSFALIYFARKKNA